jgi:hypothetical protein
MGIYLFGKTKSRKVKKVPIKADFITETPAQLEMPGVVQGIQAESLPEWWAALALNQLKIDYEFQYSVMGGRAIRGGQVVDFYVYTKPLPTPMQIEGEYWHGGIKNAETQLKNAQLNRYFSGYAQPVEEIWVDKMDDKESVYRKVKEALLL